MRKKTGCVVCGEELCYSSVQEKRECLFCGKSASAAIYCRKGHFICDACHAENGLAAITEYAVLTVREKNENPFEIAEAMMKDERVNMHGPEHHYLVAAALISAYISAGGATKDETGGATKDETGGASLLLLKALERAKNVPGGVCGYWGCCGACVSCGIFVSVITGASPLSKKEWAISNLITSRALENVSAHGGPRCCKRNTYLAIDAAISFASERLDVSLKRPERVFCEFSHMNKQCRQEACLYFKNCC